MIANTELLASLEILDQLYIKAPSNRDALMHSKHALLELCGWIEEAEDYIVRRCASKLLNSADQGWIEGNVLRNSGLHFDDNFRELLALVIGASKYRSMMDVLEATGRNFPGLNGKVNAFKKPRNQHAHTHFEKSRASNSTLTAYAPSLLKSHANDIYLGFSELELSLRKRRLA